MDVDIIRTEACNVCGSKELEDIIALPDLPLTGIYGTQQYVNDIAKPDQVFLCCNECGHGQLQNIIPGSFLYDSTYTHRSSISPIASKANVIFKSFLDNFLGAYEEVNLVEVGCNDLVLINPLKQNCKSIVGIDPIWKGKDFTEGAAFKIIGKFIDEIDPEADFFAKPNVVVASNTLEHVNRLYETIAFLDSISDDDAVIVVEVPSLDSLVLQNRFDQIFHQHLQYTSINSLFHLAARLKLEVVGLDHNYATWGGNLMFALSRNPKFKKIELPSPKGKPSLNLKQAYERFISLSLHFGETVQNLDTPICIFGAAQMLPILAYHIPQLRTPDVIIDDNEMRQATFLPMIEREIEAPNSLSSPGEFTGVVGAIDSSRAIVKRLIAMEFRRILLPNNIF